MIKKTICSTLVWNYVVGSLGEKKLPKCACCGKQLKKGDKAHKIATPYQKRGVTVLADHYGNRCKDVAENNNYSENCNHKKITISKVDKIDNLYFTHFGFHKQNGYFWINPTSAHSVGKTVASALECGYTVKVGGKIAHDIDEFDRLNKEVCMRNYE